MPPYRSPFRCTSVPIKLCRPICKMCCIAIAKCCLTRASASMALDICACRGAILRRCSACHGPKALRHGATRAQIKFLSKGRKRLVFTEENFVGNLADSRGRTALPLYPSGPARVAELVEKLAPVDVQLFLAVRNPASFMASTYSQALLGVCIRGCRPMPCARRWNGRTRAAKAPSRGTHARFIRYQENPVRPSTNPSSFMRDRPTPQPKKSMPHKWRGSKKWMA